MPPSRLPCEHYQLEEEQSVSSRFSRTWPSKGAGGGVVLDITVPNPSLRVISSAFQAGGGGEEWLAGRVGVPFMRYVLRRWGEDVHP